MGMASRQSDRRLSVLYDSQISLIAIGQSLVPIGQLMMNFANALIEGTFSHRPMLLGTHPVIVRRGIVSGSVVNLHSESPAPYFQ